MHPVKVGACALNQTPLDWTGNQRRIEQALEEARSQKVGVLCLPELCLSGYGCEDAFLSPSLQRTALEVLAELIPHTKGLIVNFGLPLLVQGRLTNTSCLVADGRLLGFAAKHFLPGDGIHYEPRWFKAWPLGRVKELSLFGESVAVGDLLFDCGGVRIGFEICEDAWVGARPGAVLARHGLDLLLNPSASHFAFGKQETRKHIVQEGSRAFGVGYIHCNLLGNEAGRAIYDGGNLIASGGRLLAQGPRFSMQDWTLTTATLDLDLNRIQQSRFSAEGTSNPQGDGIRVIHTEVPPVDVPPCPEPSFIPPDWEQKNQVKEEEFTRSLGLALLDYLRKSRSRGFVISLSGGADSSATACLIALMVHAGIKELGLSGFKDKFPYWPQLQACTEEQAIMAEMLTCVYQATENSSETTHNAARSLAEALHAGYLDFKIDSLVQGYVGMVEQGLERPLRWQTDDLALQNIQARVRAPGVWLLANVKGALLCATSNRSEAAVGYATMDGDTCGGISPISGIDKAYLRRWLVWLETQGPQGGFKIPSLRLVNDQQPTAELRPPEDKQTDEADLMPYEVLDEIERAAVRDKRSPVEVFYHLRTRFADTDEEQLAAWVARFFRLWCQNQWKRERYAPSFHLDDENLDPKTWCRFPILSGGYERELAQLDALLTGLKETSRKGLA